MIQRWRPLTLEEAEAEFDSVRDVDCEPVKDADLQAEVLLRVMELEPCCFRLMMQVADDPAPNDVISLRAITVRAACFEYRRLLRRAVKAGLVR